MTSASRISGQPSLPAVQTASGEGASDPNTDAAHPRTAADPAGIRAVVDDTRNAPLPITVGPDPRPGLRTGRCQCGHIAYEVTGSPDDPHLCSCEHDTRISGGPAVLWVGFRREELTWTGPGGEPTWYSTWPTLHRGFCPRCVMQAEHVSRLVVSHGWRRAEGPATEGRRALLWQTMSTPTGRPATSSPTPPRRRSSSLIRGGSVGTWRHAERSLLRWQDSGRLVTWCHRAAAGGGTSLERKRSTCWNRRCQ